MTTTIGRYATVTVVDGNGSALAPAVDWAGLPEEYRPLVDVLAIGKVKWAEITIQHAVDCALRHQQDGDRRQPDDGGVR